VQTSLKDCREPGTFQGLENLGKIVLNIILLKMVCPAPPNLSLFLIINCPFKRLGSLTLRSFRDLVRIGKCSTSGQVRLKF